MQRIIITILIVVVYGWGDIEAYKSFKNNWDIRHKEFPEWKYTKGDKAVFITFSVFSWVSVLAIDFGNWAETEGNKESK